jgi:mRNA interferase MazF
MRRGDIVWVNFDPQVGSEIKKIRSAVIVSNDTQNARPHYPRIVVVPLTSSGLSTSPFLIEVTGPKGRRNLALCDQVRAIDRSRVVESQVVGRLSTSEIQAVDEGLRVVLAL